MKMDDTVTDREMRERSVVTALTHPAPTCGESASTHVGSSGIAVSEYAICKRTERKSQQKSARFCSATTEPSTLMWRSNQSTASRAASTTVRAPTQNHQRSAWALAKTVGVLVLVSSLHAVADTDAAWAGLSHVRDGTASSVQEQHRFAHCIHTCLLLLRSHLFTETVYSHSSFRNIFS